jgi:prepilin-type N-terminal cleavage/methylation domain-containing protein
MNQQPTLEQSRSLAVRGFTVVELLVVMMVLGLLVAMGMSAYATALEQARISRTKVIIAKLDQIIMERYNGYLTRPVPIRGVVNAATPPAQVARNRLEALREIMRMELPGTQEDVLTPPTLVAQTSLNRSYRRRLPTGWTDDWQSAECLYQIVASSRDGERSALEFFSKDEIGDVDEDGAPEILDGWGNPIIFILWAPGYRSDATTPALSMQDSTIPDPFDPLKVGPHWAEMDPADKPIYLKPLIYSFGADKERGGVQLPDGTSPLNDPFRKFGGFQAGTILDSTAVADNITNHYQEAE